MNLTKKQSIFIVFIIAVIGIIALGLFIFSDLNYIGPTQETPIEALEDETDTNPFIDRERGKISQLLDVIYYEDSADILYISEDNAFVVASCLKNDKDRWYFHSFGVEEEDLQDPFKIYTGDENQQIPFEYWISEDGFICGYMYTNDNVLTVNKKPVETKNYKFTVDGKEYSLEYWYSNVEDTDEVILQYQRKDGTFSAPLGEEWWNTEDSSIS